ncbi:MAG: rod shape-determining protein [Chthoniobacteraceae bacterium]
MPSVQNPDLAIDLGTAMARVGVERCTGFAEAPARVGATPALRDGVVVEVEMASEILRHLFRRYQRLGWRGARALACAPSDATEEEVAALEIAVRGAGANEVFVVPQPLAAAMGAGADVGAHRASMVIDFGEGVTDYAVLSDGYIETCLAVRGGCCALRAAVLEAVQRETGFLLAETEIERLIRHVGVRAQSRRIDGIVVANGLGPDSTLPRRHAISAGVIADAIEAGVGEMLDAAATFVEAFEPRWLADVAESGVLLSGGGALIPGVPARFGERLGLPIVVAPAPLDSVINGAREMLGVVTQAGVWNRR